MGLSAYELAVSVGSKTLLQSCSLTFERGRITAILGPNGAGKSTLVKALLGLVAHQGSVILDGSAVHTLPPKVRAKKLAYLPQGQRHAWPLTVEAVVALGRYPHGDRDADGVVDRVIDQLGLADQRGQSVLTLSGGEQMRVALARALAVDADFLLADEPLASLDPHYQFDILETLAQVAKNDRGVLVVMHDLELAARYTDQVVLIQHGQVVAEGLPEQVMTPQIIGDVFAVRTRSAEIAHRDGRHFEVALPDGPL